MIWEATSTTCSSDRPWHLSGTISIRSRSCRRATCFDSPGDRPFDLDGQVLIFIPNVARGYDVSLESSGEESMIRTALSKSRGAASVGTVAGRVLLPKGMPTTELEVVATSSGDPGFEAKVAVSPNRGFHLTGVPSGGVRLRAYAGTELISRGAGWLHPAETLMLVLRPIAAQPK